MRGRGCGLIRIYGGPNSSGKDDYVTGTGRGRAAPIFDEMVGVAFILFVAHIGQTIHG